MSASNTIVSSDRTQVLEPSVRMKQLVEMSHNIDVDRKISISKYFHSGRELIKSASALEQKGDIEKAFVLYLRYMTLFLEKLVHHPEYNKADRAEKTLVKNECNNVFELAENLKRRIMEQYTEEYEKYKREAGEGSIKNYIVQKRSTDLQGSSPHDPNVDEIDQKFNFSQQPIENQDKGFDPFNIEELKQSFNSSRT